MTWIIGAQKDNQFTGEKSLYPHKTQKLKFTQLVREGKSTDTDKNRKQSWKKFLLQVKVEKCSIWNVFKVKKKVASWNTIPLTFFVQK